MIPPDVTPKALPPYAGVEEMRSLRTPVVQPVASWTDVFERFDTARYGSDGTPLHDPCVIASLLQTALFHRRHITVQIGTKGELTPGMTVADRWRVTGRAPNAMVMGGSGPGGVLPVVERAVGGKGGR